MRRSAAPSHLKSKKPHFVSPYARSNEANSSQSLQKEQSNTVFPIVQKSSYKSGFDSNIFQISFEKENNIETVTPSPKTNHSDLSSEEDEGNRSLTADEVLSLNNSSSGSLTFSINPVFYNVVYCKRSSKKHKKWEGDAILMIKGNTATLKDTEGKELAKGLGYKVKEVCNLSEGSKFFIGGKECEILSVASKKDYDFGNVPDTSTSKLIVPVFNTARKKKFCSPITNFAPKQLSNAVKKERDPNCIYMPHPKLFDELNFSIGQSEIVDVKIDSWVAKHLRPHQKEGVIFMYECIMGFRDSSYQGVILGDEMGLGKTLQCIALIWMLYKQGPFGKPVLRKILIITPSSLVKNWQSEFYKWLGKERIPVFAVSQNKKVNDFINSKHSVLIISYEMYVRSAELLSDIKFDLVICDEGHRLKNGNIKTSNVVMGLPTLRRILLTGTPIQNDLEEFHSIVEFVNPGILGSLSKFRRVYQDPIAKSRHPDCTEDERIVGNERAEELLFITGAFMLRRTHEVINKYLPPKVELVVFCQPTELQYQLYEHLLGSRDVCSFLTLEGFTAGHSPLGYIIALRKLCNHPILLKAAETESESCGDSVQDYMKSAFPENYVFTVQDSSKMKVVENILSSLFSLKTKERIVLVSNFVQTLDLLENLCKDKQYLYLRLDGATNSSVRLDLVNQFNSPFSKHRIFLLSSKAGGVGLNLIGASRILLYDIDWNPATDLQAMARVWRDGQTKDVHVYRLITTGTIEEKMYQRQISKQELYGAVVDSSLSHKAQFSHEELRDLFTLHKATQCQTHDVIKCSCLTSTEVNNFRSPHKEHEENPYQFNWGAKSARMKTKNTQMAELFKWKHVPSVANLNLRNTCLEGCEDDVTFLFVNTVNFPQQNEENL